MLATLICAAVTFVLLFFLAPLYVVLAIVFVVMLAMAHGAVFSM